MLHQVQTKSVAAPFQRVTAALVERITSRVTPKDTRDRHVTGAMRRLVLGSAGPTSLWDGLQERSLLTEHN